MLISLPLIISEWELFFIQKDVVEDTELHLGTMDIVTMETVIIVIEGEQI
jgi:hypothetical protein